jgi:mycothiol synthase
MIRAARSADDLALCAEINNVVNPEHSGTTDQLATAKGDFFVCDAGYAYVDRSSIPESAFAAVRVLPDSRRRGVGSSLLAAAGESARKFGCTSMWGCVLEGDDESLRFAAHRGFEEVNRDMDVLLEVAPGEGEVATGIVELSPEHLRGTYAVAAECVPEMALPQHAKVRPFDEWLEREERGSPIAFVALAGDDVVGYARLYSLPGHPQRLENGFTGVLRSHRRRGIATALKRAQIAWAAGNGYRELVTASVEGNEAMRTVNERLGYKPLPAWIVVQGAVP